MRLPRVRYTMRRLMGVVAVVALGSGVLAWLVSERALVLEPSPPPRWANPDHDVYDAALTDLIENPADPPSGTSSKKLRQIVLNSYTTHYIAPEYLFSLLCRFQNAIGADVRNDVLERNPRGRHFLLSGYRPTDTRIVVCDLSKTELDSAYSNQFPTADWIVVPQLPGYSRDGRTALLIYRIGTANTARGCALLKKVNGRWEVLERHLYLYGEE